MQKNSDVKILDVLFRTVDFWSRFHYFEQFSDKNFGHCLKFLKKLGLFIETCKMNETVFAQNMIKAKTQAVEATLLLYP